MNQPDDDLARKVVGALDRSVDKLDAGTRERLAAARLLAMARARAGALQRGAREWSFAWAMNAASPRNAYRQYGVRYLLVMCAFVLAIAGFTYWQATSPATDFAEID